MAENEKALIDAAAAINDVNPDYARAFLDGVLTAMNAVKAKPETEVDDEDAENTAACG